MEFRIDIGELSPPKYLPDGRLRVDARLTRTGVFRYRQPDGSVVREYRPPEEVFNADSMRTFGLIAVVNNHPPEGEITADNYGLRSVGTTGESIRQDGDYIVGSLVVHDPATIKDIQSGKQEVSCGYFQVTDRTPGVTPAGEEYDVIQRRIRGNHVAVVDVGRAGPGARIRMDAATMICGDGAAQNTRKIMEKELKEALERAAKAEARADAAEAKLDKAEARADAAEARADKAEARADAAETARNDAADPARIRELVTARVALETQAARVNPELKLDGLTDREVKVAVVKSLDGVELATEKSDDYVDAYYDAAVARADKADDTLANARRVAEPRQDSQVDTQKGAYATARQKMIDNYANAWRLPEEK